MNDSRTFKITLAVLFVLMALTFTGAALLGDKQKEAPLQTVEKIVRESNPAPRAVECPLSSERTAAPAPLAEVATLAADSNLSAENLALRARVLYLEKRLRVIDGPVNLWLATIRPDEEPDAKTLKMMAEYMASYPITLRTEEGLWLAERIKKDDWLQWGPTIDEAMQTYFGVERLRGEMTREQFSDLIQ